MAEELLNLILQQNFISWLNKSDNYLSQKSFVAEIVLIHSTNKTKSPVQFPTAE